VTAPSTQRVFVASSQASLTTLGTAHGCAESLPGLNACKDVQGRWVLPWARDVQDFGEVGPTPRTGDTTFRKGSEQHLPSRPKSLLGNETKCTEG
ncbi:unnamed protein product, partial [Gulo gulo]